jgi:hypothetical protein
MLSSNRSRQLNDLLRVVFDQTHQITLADLAGVNGWRLYEQVIDVGVKMVGFFDDIIQNREYFIIEIGVLSNGSVAADQFAVLV